MVPPTEGNFFKIIIEVESDTECSATIKLSITEMLVCLKQTIMHMLSL
jgi:hypothetical protein